MLLARQASADEDLVERVGASIVEQLVEAGKIAGMHRKVRDPVVPHPCHCNYHALCSSLCLFPVQSESLCSRGPC
jgi:hypothetical protein